MNLDTIELLGLVLGSSTVTVIVTSFFNRNKTKAEIESIVVDTYKDMVSDLRSELTRIKLQIVELNNKEMLYIENSNLLLKDKTELSKRISVLESENKELVKENVEFKSQIKELRRKILTSNQNKE